jgi:hypothetical protein
MPRAAKTRTRRSRLAFASRHNATGARMTLSRTGRVYATGKGPRLRLLRDIAPGRRRRTVVQRTAASKTVVNGAVVEVR